MVLFQRRKSNLQKMYVQTLPSVYDLLADNVLICYENLFSLQHTYAVNFSQDTRNSVLRTGGFFVRICYWQFEKTAL